MSHNLEYNKTDPISIEEYSQKMVGKTFRELIREDESRRSSDTITVIKDDMDNPKDKKNKGNLGQIVEERFFHYACNSDQRADFYEAGVELKVTPYRINNNGTLSAKERLILTMIDYFKVVDEAFDDSHLWQ